MWRWIFQRVLALIAMLFASVSTPTSPQPTPTRVAADTFTTAVNQYRSTPLVYSPRLLPVAQERASEAAANFVHNGGSLLGAALMRHGITGAEAGEVLCRTMSEPVGWCVPMWMASPTHAEILLGNFREIAVACVHSDGYWVCAGTLLR